MTGRQAILYGAGDLRIESFEIDPSSLGDDQVYAETEISALSTGTDLGNYLGDSTYVPGALPYPRPVGYSNVSRVVAIGAGVRDLVPGQRIFSLKPHCSAFIASERELLVPIPDAVGSDVASLSYLAQLGLAALRQTRYQAGENVLVVGLGVIGLCTTGLARAMGARVAAVANAPIRAEQAMRAGAHGAFTSDTPDLHGRLREVFRGADADIVILTANPWSAYRLSLEAAGENGRVALLGFPGRGEPLPDFNPLDPRWIYKKQLAIYGSGYSPRTECRAGEIRFNLRRNLEFILSLIDAGSVDFQPLISHRIPAAQMRDAYELARNRSKQLVAAVFEWK